MSDFPWQNAMKFGLGVLRLAPDQFWAMTPRELSAAFSAKVEIASINAPPVRSEFLDLMRQFPDKEKQHA